MPGDPVVLVSDRAGRIRSFVAALARFPVEPKWLVVGGFAVNIRISHIHRLTNDLDTLSRNQISLVEILVADPDADRLGRAKLQINQEGTTVIVDVMDDTAGIPLPSEASERAFFLARRMALATAERTELQVIEGGDTLVKTTAPIATVPALIALKTVAIPRRSQGNSPEKVGSDIHDLVRLVQGCDFGPVSHTIAEAGDELCEWVGDTLVKWFSPNYDRRYTYARLRRLAQSTDAEALTEDDLSIVADLGHALLS